MPHRLDPAHVRVTRTPLAGGADTIIEETDYNPARRILEASVRRSQSVNPQDGHLFLDDLHQRYAAWESGDRLKVEAKRYHERDYTVLVDGFIGDLGTRLIAPEHAGLEVEVLGWSFILDMVTTTKEEIFEDVAWTTIADTLVTTYLSGFTRTITSDASKATRVVFPLGMTLRESLDRVRRGLIAATAQAWEHLVDRPGGTKTYKLYKRSATVAATIKAADLLVDAERHRGSVLDVVNRAEVVGNPVAQRRKDTRSLTPEAFANVQGSQRTWAQLFTAQGTGTRAPLSEVEFNMRRSTAQSPTALDFVVARHSDNKDKMLESKIEGSTPLRNATPSAGSIANLNDGPQSTSVSFSNAGAGAVTEIAVFDLGATPPTLWSAQYFGKGGEDPAKMNLEWSDNDSTYNVVAVSTTLNNAGDKRADWNFGAGLAHRYWRLRYVSAGGDGAITITAEEWRLLIVERSATDPHLNDEDDATALVVQSSANGTITFDTIDFQSKRPYIKVTMRHNDNGAEAHVDLQISADMSTFFTLVELPSTGGDVTVVDDVFIEWFPKFQADPDLDVSLIRGFRPQLHHDGGATASKDRRLFTMKVYEHTTSIVNPTGANIEGPLAGDEMTGSKVTWNVEDNPIPADPNDLTAAATETVPRTYAAPKLLLVVGRLYWGLFHSPLSTVKKFWQLVVGTETGAGLKLKTQTFTGGTWSAQALGETFLMKLDFEVITPTGTNQDSASQTKYANLVPSGVLYASLKDETVQTKETATDEAKAIVTRLKSLRQRLTIPVPFNPLIEEGKRVTLDADVKPILGVSGDFDVVEVHHDLSRGVTRAIINEHVPDANRALGLIGALAGARRG